MSKDQNSSRMHPVVDPLKGSTELSIDVRMYRTGWQTALHRLPKVAVKSVCGDPPPPGVVSLDLRAVRPADARISAVKQSVRLARYSKEQDPNGSTGGHCKT